jgi:CheY-like chemotaxis protein
VRPITRDLLRVEDLRGTERILLVEDEEPVREVSARLLRRAGYTVIDHADGRSALKAFEQKRNEIDILVTDMMMPGIGGRELARRIRQSRHDMPIVFMSGYTDDEELRAGLDARSAFIEKPFTPELLLAKVREALASSSKVAQSA